MKIDRAYLVNQYNATSTDDGNDNIETFESWLVRQLISRIEKLEDIQIDKIIEDVKENSGSSNKSW